MCRPGIIVGPARVIGIDGCSPFDHHGICSGNQAFECFDIPAHTIFDTKPTRVIAYPISHLFRVDVAVPVDGLDHIRNCFLVSSPIEHVQHHGKRGGTAVVRGLLFVRWGTKKCLWRRWGQCRCRWNLCGRDFDGRSYLAGWACNAGRRRCIWDRRRSITNGIEHVPCISLCDFVPPCEAAVDRWDLKNQNGEQE